MKTGIIHCQCGQMFGVTTNSNETNCPQCNNIHDTSQFPEEVDYTVVNEVEPLKEGEPDGTDI